MRGEDAGVAENRAIEEAERDAMGAAVADRRARFSNRR
jgi:hypothetical protein